MPTRTDSDRVIDLHERFARGESISELLPEGGRLFVDRPLPFLCVYREPEDLRDPVAEQLVTSQASFLITPCDPPALEAVDEVVGALADAGTEHLGGFVVVELWTSRGTDEDARTFPEALRPRFQIFAPEDEALAPMLERLARSLKRVTLHKQPADVAVACTDTPAPAGQAAIGRHDGLPPRYPVIGLEVEPVYRDEDDGAIYPYLFESLRRQLAEALKRAFFRYAQTCTRLAPPHFLALGRRGLEQAVREVDDGLAELDASFSFLLQITPINADEAWDAFEACDFSEDPVFRYRPLPVDPELLKRQLFDLPVDQVEDPAFAWIMREKQEELDRRITMLRDRDSRQFFFGSLQLYGEIEPSLLRLARDLLERLPLHDYDYDSDEHLDAAAFAETAGVELAHYHAALEVFPERVQIRPDLPPGLLVSRGELMMGRSTKVPSARVEALIQHEIGTHMLTFFNGGAQPFRLLRDGLAGYEALQEGLAVLAEYLVGGLNVPRLRVLAARVVAAQAMIEGAGFVEVFRLLRLDHGFEAREAFSIAMRTFRGGGLTKDVIYLRGLHEVTNYLRKGGVLEPLYTGKIALHHLHVLEELEHRGVLRPAPLRPRFLEHARAGARLERLQSGLTFLDLVKPKP